MTFENYITFCLAYAAAVAIPGPYVAAMVARTMAQGPRTGFAMNFGAGLGDLVWGSVALFGLAIVVGFIEPAIVVLKYAGAAYIVWIGYRLITSKAAAQEAMAAQTDSTRRSVITGLTITLGNPKPVVFFMAVLPGIFDLAALSLSEKAIVMLTVVPILTAVLGCYALMAARARRMLSSTKSVQRVNRGAGAAMIGAGVAIAAG